jgi:hypothetical protein
MRFITALATLALAGAANAAFTPFTRDKLPTEPGFLHFRNAECSYADGDEGGFIPFSVLPPCSGGCGPCLGTSVFRSVIAYSPHNHTLPYDVRRTRPRIDTVPADARGRSTLTGRIRPRAATSRAPPRSSSTSRTSASS